MVAEVSTVHIKVRGRTSSDRIIFLGYWKSKSSFFITNDQPGLSTISQHWEATHLELGVPLSVDLVIVGLEHSGRPVL
jgi:hypothetical protein